MDGRGGDGAIINAPSIDSKIDNEIERSSPARLSSTDCHPPNGLCLYDCNAKTFLLEFLLWLVIYERVYIIVISYTANNG